MRNASCEASVQPISVHRSLQRELGEALQAQGQLQAFGQLQAQGQLQAFGQLQAQGQQQAFGQLQGKAATAPRTATATATVAASGAAPCAAVLSQLGSALQAEGQLGLESAPVWLGRATRAAVPDDVFCDPGLHAVMAVASGVRDVVLKSPVELQDWVLGAGCVLGLAQRRRAVAHLQTGPAQPGAARQGDS